jgi:Helix-turn-helix domain
MSRPERPIDPSWPLANFAGGLRILRSQRKVTYRELAGLTNYGVTVLSVAASGRHLPTWDVTKAYVSACGGSVPEWRHRWCLARELLQNSGNGQGHG